MAFNLSGSTITQTGTDTDLSGLSGIAGVTVSTSGNVKIYNASGLELAVNGTLTIDHFTERLDINSITLNGTLNAGLQRSSTFGSSGEFFYEGVSVVFTNPGPFCCGGGSLTVNNGGTLNMESTIFNINAVIVWNSGANVNIRNSTIVCHIANTRFRVLNPVTCDIDGLRFYNITFDILADGEFINFRNVLPFNAGIPITPALGAVGGLRTISSVPDYTATCSSFMSNFKGQKDIRIYQSEIGSSLLIVPEKTSNGISSHGGRVFHNWNLTITDDTGDALQGAKTYIKDTNNGNRAVTVTAGTINETADKVYEATSDVNGQILDQEVLTSLIYRTNSTGDISSPDGNEILDIRGKTGVPGEDLFDIKLFSYNQSLATIPNVAMKGLEPLNLNWVLFSDTLITEQDKAIASAYTSIETPQKWYDYDKSDLVDNYAGETQTYTSRSGNVVEAGAANITLNTGTNAVPIQQNLSAGVVTDETVYIGTGFLGTINTTGTVTDTGAPRTIEYGVTGGQLIINDASAPWTVNGNVVIDDIINNDPANNLIVNVTGGATVNTSEAGAGSGEVSIIASNTLTLTGILNPSKVYLFNTALLPTDPAYQLAAELVTNGTFSYIYNVNDNITAEYRIVNLSAVVVEQTIALGNADINIPITQQTDRNYENN